MPHPVWQCGLVALGGALGAVARFLATKACLAAWPNYLGAGTLSVNLLGSFAIGLILGIPGPRSGISDSVWLLLVPGLLGGLTTFSALSYETATYWSRAETFWIGWGHLAANLLLGLAAVGLGHSVGRVLIP
jgi:CrcB protein